MERISRLRNKGYSGELIMFISDLLKIDENF